MAQKLSQSPQQTVFRFEDADKLAITVDLLPVLSSVLTQLAARNDTVRSFNFVLL